MFVYTAMINTFNRSVAVSAFVLSIAASAKAETGYLFAGDRAPAAGRSGIQCFTFDTKKPGVLSPAPSKGQPGASWGESEGQALSGKRVTGITFARSNVFAVSPDTGSVLSFRGSDGAFLKTVIKGLSAPDGITTGPDGNLYISSNTEVVRCSPEGKALPGAEQIGATFAAGGGLKSASGITFGPDGNLYVANQVRGQVLRYDGKTGHFIDVFAAERMFAPSQISFGADGNLYVANTAGVASNYTDRAFDKEHGDIAKYDGKSGRYLGSFAPAAKGALSVAFGPNGDIFSNGYWNNRIARYNAATGAALGEVNTGPSTASFSYLALAKRVPGKTVGGFRAWKPAPPARPSAPGVTQLQDGAETVAGWQSALKPKGVPGHVITLASKGGTGYFILLPAKPTASEEKAAAVLGWTLKQMTGSTFPVIRETPGLKREAPLISVGRTKLFLNSGLSQAKQNLGEEGYAIAANGKQIFLAGGSMRGPINAVYALLEEDLGCRWYATDATRIPRKPTLAFKPVNRHFVPQLSIRDPFYFEAFDADWALRNRTNSSNVPIPEKLGGYPQHAIFVHSANLLVPPETYFATHPEYFAEINGKRQPSQLDLSNADVLRLVIENVKKSLRENPGSKYISVSHNDGRGYCECRYCAAIDKAEGSKAGSLLKFVNQVAEAIEPEFPEVKVSTLAYLDTIMPPKTIRPRRNVVIQLCTDSHAWKYQFDYITDSELFPKAMKAWHAIGADMYIWDYTIDFVHYMVPMLNMPVVTHNMRFYIDNGARGIMHQGSFTGPGSENGPMRAWVWTKQMWDPSLDTRALMKDFISGYYGSAAEPIWKYNDMLWKLWQKYHAQPHKIGVTKVGAHPFILEAPCSAPPTWEIFNAEFLNKTSVYMRQAQDLAKDPQTKRRVQLAKLPLLYIRLGQGLGYLEETGSYTPGSWIKKPNPARKAYYQGILTEFIDITADQKITHISDFSRTEKIVAKWKELISQSYGSLPIRPLHDSWKFRTDPGKTGNADGWAASELDEKGWSNARSGKGTGWEKEGFADYSGQAWYRQRFSVPADIKTQKYIYLYFAGVDSESEIYINGRKAFAHTIASTGLTVGTIWNDPFAFDVKPFLNSGPENSIAIKVSSAGGVRGLYRPIFLVGSKVEMQVEQLANAVLRFG